MSLDRPIPLSAGVTRLVFDPAALRYPGVSCGPDRWGSGPTGGGGGGGDVMWEQITPSVEERGRRCL